MSDSNNTVEINSWENPITKLWEKKDLPFLRDSDSADIAEKVFYTSDPQFLLATLTELMQRGHFRKAAEVTRILVQTIPESPLDFSPDVHIKYIE